MRIREVPPEVALAVQVNLAIRAAMLGGENVKMKFRANRSLRDVEPDVLSMTGAMRGIVVYMITGELVEVT